MIQTLYCYECGHKTEQLKTGLFDVYTGEPVTKPECRNPACYLGCDNTGGHKWDGWFKTGRCKKCGHYERVWD
jgi:hypothetical protein